MNPLIRMLACGPVLVTVGLHGADQGLELQHSAADKTVLESPANQALAFWERFETEFEKRTADNFADRLHPFSSLNWKLRLDDGGSEFFHEQTTRSARKALSRSFSQSLREASVDLPLMTWLKDRQGHLADFLRNSVGNVREEAVAPSELSYRPVERSWWDQLSETSRLKYGIRPFRTAPYAYASVGFRDGENVLLLANVRYVFRDFAEHKFELAFSLPLTHELSVDVGAACQFDHHKSDEHLVLRLFKRLNHGGLFYISMELQQEPSLYAGLSFAM